MKKVILFPFLVVIILIAAGEKVPCHFNDVGLKGDRVQICGEIIGAKFNDKTGTTILFLSSDPNGPVVNIIIPQKNRNAFNGPPENYFLGRNVCVRGSLVKSKLNLEIFVTQQAQIKLDMVDNTIQSMH